MRRRITLKVKFILLIVLGLTVIFLIIAIAGTRQMTKNLRAGLITQSKSFAALATKPIGDTFVTYQDSGRIKIVQQIEKFTDLDSNVSNVTVVDLNGQALYQQKDGLGIHVTAVQASSFEPIYVMGGDRLTRIITPYIEDFGAHRYSIIYDISDQAIERSVSQLRAAVIALAFFALLTSIIVSYLLINRLFLNPLGQVSNSAISISKGNLGLKIEPKRNDEIGDVAIAVNTMADALKADISKLKEIDAIKTEFMMIASHNLRTPLTIIQGYLDNLLVTKDLAPDVRDTVEVVAASGSRLAVFAEDILTVSQLEAGEKDVMRQREDTDIVDLLVGIIKDVEPLVTEKKLKLVTAIDIKTCMIKISLPHFRAAIWNLLDNALKFTQKGTITVGIKMVDKKAVITVGDTGVGIAPDEVPKLFTKFHRATSTLNYDYEGTGIGLYLTKLIIEQHGGTVAVDSKLGKGTTVALTVPLSSNNDNQTPS